MSLSMVKETRPGVMDRGRKGGAAVEGWRAGGRVKKIQTLVKIVDLRVVGVSGNQIFGTYFLVLKSYL